MSSIPAASAEAAAPPPPAVRHPLRLPHFRNLWIGATISLLGDQFYVVALPWLVLQMTGSGLALKLLAPGHGRIAERCRTTQRVDYSRHWQRAVPLVSIHRAPPVR